MSSPHQHRYIVMGGTLPDIYAWRRSQGLAPGDVVAVSITARDALRGLSGCFKQVVLPSWDRASPGVKAEVQRNLEIVCATSPACPWREVVEVRD